MQKSIPNNYDEIKDNILFPYVVFEYVSNKHTLSHGLLAENKYEALREIHETLLEYDNEKPHLLGVEKTDFF